ncbi:MAG TPA: methyltransferase domain-containing protein [Vicinamibacterales bacterium]|nr:methyltransferase domain-containing protein [Vicinamibacterales bacterium]
MSTGVATYYDRLGRWNAVARVIGYGGGRSALTVHRALADPRANGRPTFTRLHDVLIAQLAGLRAPRVLDAGCGLGGTMLALAQALGAQCTGVTLSASQAATANEAAARAGLASSVHALVQSYDAPPDGPFDLIVAIESLAHSADPARSLQALAGVLAPSGRLVVVDDMPEAVARGSADLALFQTGWQCPVLWSARDIQDAMRGCGLTCEIDVDLTSEVRPRSRGVIAALSVLNRLARSIPSPAWRQVLNAHQGGLALERLLRNGWVRYRLLVARRPELRLS